MSLKIRSLYPLGSCMIIAFFISVGCSEKPQKNAGKGGVQNKTIFQCAQDKTITTVFRDDSVSLKLSDGREMMLPQVRSASGTRYANTDETIILWNKGNTAFITEKDSVTYKNCVIQGEADLTNLEVFRSRQDSIVLRYPKVLYLYQKAVIDTSGWSYASTAKGQLVAQLKSKDKFQPKTNLSEAYFSVGWTKNPGEVKSCLSLPQGFNTKSDTISRGGITYQRAQYSNAGAGNYYDIVQYRTVRNGRCYSLEEMVHSTNIHNYPKERDINEFDSLKVWRVLEVPAETLSFTNK